MIKYNSEKKEVAAKGKLLDIVSEVLFIVGEMYKAYLEQNPKAADMYKDVIISEINDKDFWKMVEEKTKKSSN